MWGEIWNIVVWLGTIGVTVVAILLLLKVIGVFLTWMKQMKRRDASELMMTVLKSLPIFIIGIPIVKTLIEIFSGADDLADFYISTEVYHSLVVEQTVIIALFIVAWTIIYITALIANEKYWGGRRR